MVTSLLFNITIVQTLKFNVITKMVSLFIPVAFSPDKS